jgi:hypothetical protein
MKLYDNWKEILRKSWSLKFIFLAAILTGCEAVLPLYWDSFPRDVFASLTFCTILAASIARLVAQKDI